MGIPYTDPCHRNNVCVYVRAQIRYVHVRVQLYLGTQLLYGYGFYFFRFKLLLRVLIQFESAVSIDHCQYENCSLQFFIIGLGLNIIILKIVPISHIIFVYLYTNVPVMLSYSLKS